MRAIVQRVSAASVAVDGTLVSRIGKGLLVFLGVGQGDSESDLAYLVRKVAGLRIFGDDHGAMNRSPLDVGASVLLISQFTLYGDVRRGQRPSFIQAMNPADAEPLYLRFADCLVNMGLPCKTGVFGATMTVSSTNDGPVTLLIDSRKLF